MRRESCRDPGEILAAGIFLPDGNLAGKRNSWRPKSRRDPAANLAKILAGKQKSRRPKSRRDSCREPHQDSRREAIIPAAKILARFLPRTSPRFLLGSNNPSGQNLAGMLPRVSPRFSPRSKFKVAKTSARFCRESRQDWRWEAKFLVRFTAGIPAKF